MQDNAWAVSADSSFALLMQSDGNLVLYQVIGAPPTPNSTFDGCAVWNTATQGHTGASFAVQSDGNLVVYDGTEPIWNSGTAGARIAFLDVQPDGNLVLYGVDGGAVWATHTNGNRVPLFPTLKNGMNGYFEYKKVIWRNINNEGDNGVRPTITLDSSTLRIYGGYQFKYVTFGGWGEGMIDIAIRFSLHTCVATVSIAGALFETVNAAWPGSWQPASTDGGVSSSLDNGTTLQVTLDSDGIEVRLPNDQRIAFVNSAVSPPGATTRHDPA